MKVFTQSLICELESLETQPTFFEQLSLFNQSLKSTLNQFVPIQHKLILPKKTVLPEWMDEEYKQQRRLRRKFERDKNKYRTEVAKTRYNQQRDLCVAMANKKQKQFYSNCFKKIFFFKFVKLLAWKADLPLWKKGMFGILSVGSKWHQNQ